jgi:hypothetical protein
MINETKPSGTLEKRVEKVQKKKKIKRNSRLKRRKATGSPASMYHILADR